MLLITADPTRENGTDPDVTNEYMTFTREIADSGELVAGEALQAVDTATTVRVRDGKKATTDGPFAETKEVLGGFYIVNVASLERAQELAAKIPGAKTGQIEVRPLLEMPAPVES
jgi:hypothetical protein